MHFDLLKAFVAKDARRGKVFIFSPAIMNWANEQIDRVEKQRVGSREATEQFQAPASAEQSGQVV